MTSGNPSDASAAAGAFDVQDSVDAVLARELATSLALRSRAMSWLLGVATLNVAIVMFAVPELGEILIPDAFPRAVLLGILVLLWILEVVVLTHIRRTGRASVKHPVAEQVVSLLEISAVSVFLALAAIRIDPPIASILGPAAWLYFPLIGISTLTLKPQVVVVTGMVATLQFAILAFWLTGPHAPAGPEVPALLLSRTYHLQKVLLLFFTTGIAAAVAYDLRRRLRRIAKVTRERGEIVNLFGQHTSPEVVQALVEGGGSVVPERREVGILFLDIRGFTAASEQVAPETVVARLDAFFELVVPVVRRNGGIVHQLLGDGFMAIFGAPVAHGDDARRALRTAIEIHDLIHAASGDGRLEDTRVVMGVHWGEVVAGPVGAQDHKEYKVTGDAVNVAARLEVMAKDAEAEILTSRAAVAAAGLEEEVREDLGEVVIRGRARPLRVLRLR